MLDNNGQKQIIHLVVLHDRLICIHVRHRQFAMSNWFTSPYTPTTYSNVTFLCRSSKNRQPGGVTTL